MNPRVPHQKTAALTLVEVLLIIAVLAILAAMLLPANGHGPKYAKRLNCISNLREIGHAYLVWAGDHDDKFPMQVSVTNGGTMELTADGKDPWLNFLAMSNELNAPKVLICPADERGVKTMVWTNGLSATNISYFVGLDATKRHPKMFLSGDDNFAIGGVPVKSGLLEFSTNAPIAWNSGRHVYSKKSFFRTYTQNVFLGNIGFADGSVTQINPPPLQKMLVETGLATNRLAIP